MQLGVLFGGQLLGGGMLMKMAVMGASVAGSLLMKQKSKKNPNKLNDLRVSSSTFGRGIPIVWGTMRVTGNMFWSTEFREDHYYMTNKGKRVEGKKGEKKADKGKANEMYDYYANFAMGLAAGPVEGLLRIWADNNLIYNKINPTDEDLVGPGFSQGEARGKSGHNSTAGKGKGRSGASGRFAFRFYKGNEEQLPDRFMQGMSGPEKSPGYRGLCYLFFEDFALKDFGNRIPTITCEISVKEHRRPMIETIENMEPKNSFSNKLFGSAHLDTIKKRLYHKCTIGGVHYIRAFDMEKLVEVARIDVSTAGNWLGMSHRGDFVFCHFSQNVSPIAFVDPDSMVVKKIWGGSGIWVDDQRRGIFGARFAVPLAGLDGSMEAAGWTAVHGWDGVHIFDSSYNFSSFVDGEGRVLKRLFLGQPGAVTATGHGSGAYAISSNIYAWTEQIYAFSPDPDRENLMNRDMEKVFTWPKAEWVQEGFEYGGIAWAGVVVGAKCLAIIAWWNSKGTYAFKLDYQTGEVLWEKFLGDSGGPSEGFMSPPISSTNQLSWFSGRTVYTIDWRQETASSIQVGASAGDGNRVWLPSESFGEYYLSDKDAILYFSNEVDEGKWIICYLDRKTQTKVMLSDIVRDVAMKCRIPYNRINTVGLTADEEVTGYMVENPTPGRGVLEELAEVFQFDAVESDNVLKFISRGKNPVMTITQENLGVVETDFGGENEYYVETRQQEIELPKRCVVEFVDAEKKYETGNQSYARPLRPLSVMGSQERLDVTLNMAMKPLRAKLLAQRILFAAWGERTSHEYTIGQDYLMLDPSDVIQVNLDNNETFIDRITDIETGADYSMKLTTVSQHAEHYRLTTTVGDPGGVVTLPYTPPPNAHAAIFDTPYLFDMDADRNPAFFEYYWAACAFGPGYSGGTLSSRSSTGENKGKSNTEGFSKVDAIWGYCVTTVPAPPSGMTEITDTETVLELVPGFDFNQPDVRYTWESISDADWPNLDNMLIIGDEVMLFKNVEELDNGHVKISHLIRGYRGSGIAAFNHPPASDRVVEEFVIVSPMSVHDSDHDLTEMFKTRTYMISTASITPSWLLGTDRALKANTRRPFQVGGVHRDVWGTGVRVTFKRATRYGGELLSGVSNVPINEQYEKYEVYWLHAPYDKTTWNVDDASLYWRKDELTDQSSVSLTEDDLFAASKNYLMDMHLVIYQMSDQVGHGFPRYVTLPYSKYALH